MTFYEKLEKHFKVGKCVIVRDDSNMYCAFYPFRNSLEATYHSHWLYDLNLVRIVRPSGAYSEVFINKTAKKDNWKIVETFQPKYERFKIGDKVRVREDAKEWCKFMDPDGFTGFFRDMAGKIVKITGYDLSDYRVQLTDNSLNCCLPHQALEYPIEEECCSGNYNYCPKCGTKLKS